MDRAIYSATTRALCYTPVGKASLKPRSWSGEHSGVSGAGADSKRF
jgi:hypothetical protein